jgi:hypothetical protein
MATKKTSKKTSKETEGSSEEKPKLEKMSQTHAMVEEEQATPRTLDQVWGDTGVGGKYKTLDEVVYRKQLGHMSKSDLKAHATSIGLMPVDNVRLLQDRLIREFKLHVSSYARPLATSNEVHISHEVRDILEEGK